MQGTRIGQYKLVRVLGQGAFGEVWLADDERLKRPVAIKRLKLEVIGDADARRRFDSEAEILIGITEPHVVHVFDRIEIDGAPALVTEYMKGGSISDLRKTREDSFTVDEVMRWAEQAALGLSAMHRRGILHRDIKPANLFLSEDGNLSIGDFGLARDVDKTQTLGLQGTMPYMSPEQIKGLEIDARTDLFALGVSLYQMLTGELPFGKGLDRSERLSSVRTQRKEVPAVLSDTIDALLEVDREKRVQSADELVASLRGNGPGRSIRIPSGRRLLAIAPVLVAVIVGVAFGRCWIPGTPWCGTGDCELDPPPERRVAILPFEYRGDPEFARLAEEVPALVAARIDGVGGISAPRPSTFDACAPDVSLMSHDSAEIASWMEAQHVDLLVHGVISELRSQLRIDLIFRYQGSSGFTPDKQALTFDDVADALPAVNDVGLEALRHLLVEPKDDVSGQALMSCESFEAMCAYLDGHEAIRGLTFSAAGLDRAVELDSTMAMAHYERSWVAAWLIEGVDQQKKFLAPALRHSDKVGYYGQQLIESARLELEDDLVGAETVLLDLVAREARSPWAWVRLGDLHRTHNSSRGRPWWESRRELEHAAAMDEANRIAPLLLTFVKTAEGDVEYLRQFTADRSRGGAAAIAAFTFGSQAMRDSVLTVVGDSWCGVGFHTNNVYILIFPDNHHNILQFLEAHVCGEGSAIRQRPADEAWLSLALAHTNAGMGRWEEASRWFSEVPDSFRPWGLVYEALALSLPFIPAEDAEVERLIGELERWRPLAEPVLVDPEQLGMLSDRFNPHLHVHEHLRLYCLAALHAKEGEVLAAQEALAALRATGIPREYERFVGDLVAIAEARISLAAGDHATALEHLDRVVRMRYQNGGYSSFFQRADFRFLRAECLVALGRPEEALGWYEASDQEMEFLLIYTGMAHLRQAQANEQLDRIPEAIHHYRIFLDLFDEADAFYTDDVSLARQRLTALETAR